MGLFGKFFSIAPPFLALRGLPYLGSFSIAQQVRDIEGSPWLGSYSVDRPIRPLKEHLGWGPPLYFCSSCIWWAGLSVVQLLMLACGEREAMVMAPTLTCDSAVSSCFHGCPSFFHRHFSSQSPPSHPFDPSLYSQQQPSPLDCSTIPKLQLPAAAPSREPMFLSRVCMAAARTVWFSFHLGCHRSAVSLSTLNVSPLTQTIAQMWGSDPRFSSPTRWGHVKSY